MDLHLGVHICSTGIVNDKPHFFFSSSPSMVLGLWLIGTCQFSEGKDHARILLSDLATIARLTSDDSVSMTVHVASISGLSDIGKTTFLDNYSRVADLSELFPSELMTW